MSVSDLGRITSDGDTSAVRLERDLDAIPEEVWAAITEPDRLRDWLAPTEIEAREGGRVTIDFSRSPEGSVVRGTVRICDPPRTLEYDWEETGENRSILRFELEPSELGTKISLTHRLLMDEEVPSVAAGWHVYLEGLAEHVRGIGRSPERAERLYNQYLELRAVYSEVRTKSS